MKALIKYLPVEIKMKGIFKKMPFAVTQDIEVGDEVESTTNTGTKHKVIKKDGDKVWTDITSDAPKRWFPELNFFKILGEVSPEATFVEDGKEYEAFKEPKLDMDKPPGEELIGYIYKVKCPTCKYYH